LKKIIAILLLSSLFLNITGYHLVFYFRQAEIKAEMKKALPAQAGSEDENNFVFPWMIKRQLHNWKGKVMNLA